MLNKLTERKKRIAVTLFFTTILLIAIVFFASSERKVSFCLAYQPQETKASSWENARIWFDFDSIDIADSKLVGIYEVNDSGVYDEARYIKIRGMIGFWPFADGNYDFYMNQEMDQCGKDEGCSMFNIEYTEGYIIVVGSDTNGGGNWDDFAIRVRIYADGDSYCLSGDQKNWIGDSNSNRLRFIVYRYTFYSGTPEIDIAAKYTWGNEWKECYPNSTSWSGFQNYVDNFWVGSDNYNGVYTALDLVNWTWPNPY